jgi:pyrimidine-nucleoside phosphorylase
MNQPLGHAVGNALEVHECVTIMRGEMHPQAQPVLELSLELAARMVEAAGLEPELDSARARVQRALDSGAALDCFRQNVEAQGGDTRVVDDPSRLLPLTLTEVKVESPRAGFVTGVDAAEIGNAVASIGGGRARIEDRIDPAVGFLFEAKVGDQVSEGEAVGLLYCRDEKQAKLAGERIRAAYTIGDAPSNLKYQLIKEVITA